MSHSSIVYRYDGSFDGLLCCVFDSYANHIDPVGIIGRDHCQATFYDIREVETDPAQARRVSLGIHQKISPQALYLVRRAFLTCLEEKELHILRFIRFGFTAGSSAIHMLTEERVDVLVKAVNHMSGEAHLLKGFVRFSDIGGVLAAEIEPKNFVLPLIAPHFCSRLSGETFMIYDRTHRAALLYSHGEKEIVTLEEFTMPPAPPDEKAYRSLWKRFYDTIAIEQRENPRCRMGHMPKRYWGVMTEFTEQDSGETVETLPPSRRAALPPDTFHSK